MDKEIEDLLKEPKFKNKVEKWATYAVVWIVMMFIKAIVQAVEEKDRFDKKYKTVIKVNCLGFKSYEYHERN